MLNIIIVDDDIICSTILVDYLSVLSTKITVADNCSDATKLLAINKYDYAFVDLNIEECNGLDIVRFYMNHEHLTSCKFYIVTSESNIYLGNDVNRISILDKPLNREKLISIMQ